MSGHRRGRRHHALRRRKEQELRELERAFAQVWAQRILDPEHHETPCGLCFPDVPTWRSWLRWVEACHPDLDVLTITSVAPVVLVVFIQQRSREWLPATLVDELLTLARPDGDRSERSRAPPARQRAGGLIVAVVQDTCTLLGLIHSRKEDTAMPADVGREGADPERDVLAQEEEAKLWDEVEALRSPSPALVRCALCNRPVEHEENCSDSECPYHLADTAQGRVAADPLAPWYRAVVRAAQRRSL